MEWEEIKSGLSPTPPFFLRSLTAYPTYYYKIGIKSEDKVTNITTWEIEMECRCQPYLRKGVTTAPTDVRQITIFCNACGNPVFRIRSSDHELVMDKFM